MLESDKKKKKASKQQANKPINERKMFASWRHGNEWAVSLLLWNSITRQSHKWS